MSTVLILDRGHVEGKNQSPSLLLGDTPQEHMLYMYNTRWKEEDYGRIREDIELLPSCRNLRTKIFATLVDLWVGP